MHECIPFVSACPNCSRQQLQRGFSRAVLLRLLNADAPIEAYCASCDEFWTIDSHERTAIAGELHGREADRSRSRRQGR